MINETFRFQHKFNFLKEASFQEKNYIPLLYIPIAFYGLLQWLRSKKSTCYARDTGDTESLGQKDLLEKGMATHSSILYLRMLWTEEAGGLQSTVLQRVGHDCSDLACIASYGLSW